MDAMVTETADHHEGLNETQSFTAKDLPRLHSLVQASPDRSQTESSLDVNEGENWLRLTDHHDNLQESSVIDVDASQSQQDSSTRRDTTPTLSIHSLKDLGVVEGFPKGCFLCIDVDGAVLAIKDVRSLTTLEGIGEEKKGGAVAYELRIARKGQSTLLSSALEHLTRRQLRVLHHGDRLVIVSAATGAVALVLEYRYDVAIRTEPVEEQSQTMLESMDDTMGAPLASQPAGVIEATLEAAAAAVEAAAEAEALPLTQSAPDDKMAPLIATQPEDDDDDAMDASDESTVDPDEDSNADNDEAREIPTKPPLPSPGDMSLTLNGETEPPPADTTHGPAVTNLLKSVPEDKEVSPAKLTAVASTPAKHSTFTSPAKSELFASPNLLASPAETDRTETERIDTPATKGFEPSPGVFDKETPRKAMVLAFDYGEEDEADDDAVPNPESATVGGVAPVQALNAAGSDDETDTDIEASENPDAEMAKSSPVGADVTESILQDGGTGNDGSTEVAVDVVVAKPVDDQAVEEVEKPTGNEQAEDIGPSVSVEAKNTSGENSGVELNEADRSGEETAEVDVRASEPSLPEGSGVDTDPAARVEETVEDPSSLKLAGSESAQRVEPESLVEEQVSKVEEPVTNSPNAPLEMEDGVSDAAVGDEATDAEANDTVQDGVTPESSHPERSLVVAEPTPCVDESMEDPSAPMLAACDIARRSEQGPPTEKRGATCTEGEKLTGEVQCSDQAAPQTAVKETSPIAEETSSQREAEAEQKDDPSTTKEADEAGKESPVERGATRRQAPGAAKATRKRGRTSPVEEVDKTAATPADTSTRSTRKRSRQSPSSKSSPRVAVQDSAFRVLATNITLKESEKNVSRHLCLPPLPCCDVV